MAGKQGKDPEARQMIVEDHLDGLPGLSGRARDALLAQQPETVREALEIRGVGRRTTRALLRLGLISDPDGAQGGAAGHDAHPSRR
jgi:hypothetical protein